MDKVKEIIAHAPETPGVYLMKDKTGAVIYIGKAKSLKNRSYELPGKGPCR